MIESESVISNSAQGQVKVHIITLNMKVCPSKSEGKHLKAISNQAKV